MTNRDLYRFVGELGRRDAAKKRTLEQYLAALLGLARRRHSSQADLAVTDFCGLLADALTADPVAFDPAWRAQYAALDRTRPGFDGWEAAVIRQIVDLREMDEDGTLRDEWRFFGVNAPHGARWYNFTPAGYLEAAAEGALGGWDPDEPSDRVFVPGEVVVMDDDGGFQSVAPQDIARPVSDLIEVSWEQFQDFLHCGRYYE